MRVGGLASQTYNITYHLIVYLETMIALASMTYFEMCISNLRLSFLDPPLSFHEWVLE